jgi:aminopeptidase N
MEGHHPRARDASPRNRRVAATASADDDDRYTAGSSGLGDPFFPNAGNGGYDVTSYDLDYTPATRALAGKAFITAEATQDLNAFNLDLRDFYAVSRVAVGKDNGPSLKEMAFSHEGQELTIAPRPKLKTGETFVVLVEYAGTAQEITDPDESIEGFVPTDDGAFVVSEPQGAPGWYPANDIPTDKALFDISITVPEGITALGTASSSPRRRRTARRPGSGATGCRWRPTSPRRRTASSRSL